MFGDDDDTWLNNTIMITTVTITFLQPYLIANKGVMQIHVFCVWYSGGMKTIPEGYLLTLFPLRSVLCLLTLIHSTCLLSFLSLFNYSNNDSNPITTVQRSGGRTVLPSCLQFSVPGGGGQLSSAKKDAPLLTFILILVCNTVALELMYFTSSCCLVLIVSKRKYINFLAWL